MVKKINLESLKKGLDQKEFVLIEVLDPELYRLIHIPGAINIPYKDIVERTEKEFSKDQTLVLYCIDWDCPVSRIAAEKLEEIGFHNVYYFPGGKLQWIESGSPTVRAKVKSANSEQSPI